MTSGAWYTVNGRKLRKCKRCGGHDLAWAQSKRTGRYYLAETRIAISESESGTSLKDDTYWVMPNRPHKCNPEREAQARRDFAQEWDARRDADARFNAAVEAERVLTGRAPLRPDDDAFNRDWLRMKNEFAEYEAAQERAAFEAKMRRDEALMGHGR